MSTLPSLFVSHGSPTFAIDAGSTGPALKAFGSQLPTDLRGVVIMSPHWTTRTPMVMTTAQPQTWHDFGGFPEVLYTLQYPAPGSPGLAQEVLDLLAQAGMPAQADAQRPFDHGAWVPLLHLMPNAQVPVVQVSMPARWDGAQLYAMGRALQSLRERDVLVVGSGSMTHNLAEFFGGQHEVAPYVQEFSRWVEQQLQEGDLATLLQHRSNAPHAHRAHPTDDHFLPLFFALGAAGEDARPSYLSREVMFGMLAMDCMTFAAPGVTTN